MGSRSDRGAVEYAALARALDEIMPPCTGDPRFIAEASELAQQEVEYLSLTVCRECPLRALCRAYAETARPPAGIWAGRVYKPSQLHKQEKDLDRDH